MLREIRQSKEKYCVIALICGKLKTNKRLREKLTIIIIRGGIVGRRALKESGQKLQTLNKF